MSVKVKICPSCTHFEVCKIIESFKNTLTRHIKVFIPSDKEGPKLKLYKVIAEDCRYFKEGE